MSLIMLLSTMPFNERSNIDSVLHWPKTTYSSCLNPMNFNSLLNNTFSAVPQTSPVFAIESPPNFTFEYNLSRYIDCLIFRTL